MYLSHCLKLVSYYKTGQMTAKAFSVLTLLFISFSLIAQEDLPWKEASKESQAYHQYRIKLSIPPYSLPKIKKLVKGIKANDEDDMKLKSSIYQSLSLREKFTYHMIHAESFSQNCDAMPPIQDEQKKIFGQLPDAFDEFRWSDGQIKFLKTNKDSVVALIKESIARTGRIGLNYKAAIAEMNAKEMIPLLISTYQSSKKDHDILTVLMLLMKEGKYAPFTASASYKKLYGEESNYLANIVYNIGNEDLVLKRATEFYNAGAK